MIYRDDGRIFGGPRTDFNAWGLQDEKILMGSNEGCTDKVSHSSHYICRIFANLNLYLANLAHYEIYIVSNHC